MAIIRNAIQCNKCGDIIESFFVHDYKTCSCGACSVDGGNYYFRRCAKSHDDFTDLSEFQEDLNEEIALSKVQERIKQIRERLRVLTFNSDEIFDVDEVDRLVVELNELASEMGEMA